MWQTKDFKTKQQMDRWLEKNEHQIQWREIFVNNAYCVEFRFLLVFDIE